MLDRTQSTHVAIDRDIVWRVSEHEVGTIAAHQPSQVRRVTRIAAKQSVPTEFPQIAEAGHRGTGYQWNLVLRCIAALGVRLPCLIEDQIDFCEAEPGMLDLKLEVDQRLQLDRQNLFVPSGV